MALSKGKKLLIMGAILLVIDQVSKVLVKTNMSIGESFPVLGQWFRIAFVENEGMAFGMAFGGVVGKYILTAFRIILSGLLIWWIRDMLKKETPMGFLIPLSLITAGAIGNVIDCVFYGVIWNYAPLFQGKVVDMLYFPLIDTYIGGKHITFFDPVFNVADSFVTVGAVIVIICAIFVDKNLFSDKKKKEKSDMPV